MHGQLESYERHLLNHHNEHNHKEHNHNNIHNERPPVHLTSPIEPSEFFRSRDGSLLDSEFLGSEILDSKILVGDSIDISTLESFSFSLDETSSLCLNGGDDTLLYDEDEDDEDEDDEDDEGKDLGVAIALVDNFNIDGVVTSVANNGHISTSEDDDEQEEEEERDDFTLIVVC